jgi:nucleotide-binding universal stress UspA family protein
LISIARVLCPIDFSDASQHALAHAVALARWYEARLTVLHVYGNRPTMDLPPLVLSAADREQLMSRMKEAVRSVAPDLTVDYLVREAGWVDEEIVKQAGENRIDLLVLGTHGRSGFKRLFLGSVTEKVVRRATCPTLVVPPRVSDAAAPVIVKRILCAVDLSEYSLNAVAFAISLAEEADARLTLLHVVEPAPVLAEPVVPSRSGAALVDASVVDARQKLYALIPDEARTYCIVETDVADGRADREIVRHAAEKCADLIVMGRHSGGRVDQLLFGSTTHHVIREAPCPVLVVR